MLTGLSNALERRDVEDAKAILNAWQLGKLHGGGCLVASDLGGSA